MQHSIQPTTRPIVWIERRESHEQQQVDSFFAMATVVTTTWRPAVLLGQIDEYVYEIAYLEDHDPATGRVRSRHRVGHFELAQSFQDERYTSSFEAAWQLSRLVYLYLDTAQLRHRSNPSSSPGDNNDDDEFVLPDIEDAAPPQQQEQQEEDQEQLPVQQATDSINVEDDDDDDVDDFLEQFNDSRDQQQHHQHQQQQEERTVIDLTLDDVHEDAAPPVVPPSASSSATSTQIARTANPLLLDSVLGMNNDNNNSDHDDEDLVAVHAEGGNDAALTDDDDDNTPFFQMYYRRPAVVEGEAHPLFPRRRGHRGAVQHREDIDDVPFIQLQRVRPHFRLAHTRNRRNRVRRVRARRAAPRQVQQQQQQQVQVQQPQQAQQEAAAPDQQIAVNQEDNNDNNNNNNNNNDNDDNNNNAIIDNLQQNRLRIFEVARRSFPSWRAFCESLSVARIAELLSLRGVHSSITNFMRQNEYNGLSFAFDNFIELGFPQEVRSRFNPVHFAAFSRLRNDLLDE